MSHNHGGKIVRDGLVLCLDAGNPKSYIGSGTNWADLSKNNSTGSLKNGPTFDGANGGSIVFDGIDDRVIGETFSGITGNSARSVCCWVKTSSNKTFQIFDSGTINTSNQAHQVGLAYNGVIGGSSPYNSGAFFIAFWANDLAYPINYTQIFDGKWHYYSYSYDPNGRKVYICCDGQANNTAYIWSNAGVWSTQSSGQPFIMTADLNTSAQQYYVGSARTGIWVQNDWYSGGNIGSIYVYNKALSPSDLLQNYNTTRRRFGV